MKNLILICAVVVLAACAMPPGGMAQKRPGGGSLFWNVSQAAVEQPQQHFVDETVEVITEPAGARIHINDGFVGYSPLKAPVRRLWRGDPRYPMTLDTVKIEALPVAGGQCVQSVMVGQNSGKTPPQVSFNMTACSAAAPAAPAPAKTE